MNWTGPSLQQLVAPAFPRQAVREGYALKAGGAVAHVRGGPDYVEAEVQERGFHHSVALHAQGSDLAVSCSCMSHRRGGSCAHAWASLLAGEEAGHLESMRQSLIAELSHGPAPLLDLLEALGREAHPAPARKDRPPTWRELLQAIQIEGEAESDPGASRSELVYWIDPNATIRSGALTVEVGRRRRKKSGAWTRPHPKRLASYDLESLPRADRVILETLMGGRDHAYRLTPGYTLSEGLMRAMLPELCRTGRFFLVEDGDLDRMQELTWDGDLPWTVRSGLDRDEKRGLWIVRGRLERGGETLLLSEPKVMLSPGYFVARGKVSTFLAAGGWPWVFTLRQRGELAVPFKEQAEFRRTLYASAEAPDIVWPEGLRLAELRTKPVPRLRLTLPKVVNPEGARFLDAAISFDYDGEIVHERDRGSIRLSTKGDRLIVRDTAAEAEALRRLPPLDFAEGDGHEQGRLEIAAKDVPRAVRELLAAGWRVEAEKGVFRQPSSFSMSVRSGIDWFDLEGGATFDGQVVPFPRLLEAIRQGKPFVTLGDGSQGVLPEEWLKKMGFLLGAAEVAGDVLRFRPSQAALLDALLACEKDANCDEAFERLRAGIRSFEGIVPRDPSEGFQGELRPYQKVGLGWMEFLRTYRLGGCLADDMGLGKTVQVLALLEARRREKAGPSLVVVPRSLIFNWQSEARRFCPKLRVLDYAALDRLKDPSVFAEADLVLVTYGTLRRDAAILKDVAFDHVILDEAQAIKNPQTATAKAARLLKGSHRLALSGTPIENHLGELWSLFEFLNPGMLGRASAFRGVMEGEGKPEGAARHLLARALRPFILRREKKQVATELPERLEQTLTCELGAAERALYDEIRDHYRSSLDGKVREQGFERSKMHVLEALLRLRQAACHPGLLDAKRRGEPGTKTELLLEQVKLVVAEGHKALVFSQFTSLLSIVRARLDAEKLPYEYLDGQTRDRSTRVERFQTDPDCRLFLISLKAGGLGLNLTAAEYVYLLDPWWNPAVEAQAIDRAHRIGQSRRVFACRIVAKDTVEEKILELQRSKKELAEALISVDNAVLKNLTREDLELLLS